MALVIPVHLQARRAVLVDQAAEVRMKEAQIPAAQELPIRVMRVVVLVDMQLQLLAAVVVVRVR